MNILRIYDTILLESNIESCQTMFGRELFGQELGGSEKDTRIEKRFAKLIGDFTSSDYGHYIKPSFTKAIETLKSCLSPYKEVLMPETTQVYRGLTIPLSYFLSKRQPIITSQPFKYVYKARNPIQSWSLSHDVASIFGNNMEVNLLGDKFVEGGYNQSVEKVKEFIQIISKEYSDIRVGFVLQHKSSKKDFMIKSKYLSLLSNNSHEEEILRITNEPIQVYAKFNDHVDVFLTHNGQLMLSLISRFI